MLQALASENVALDEARVAARAGQLRATAALEAATEEAHSAGSRAAHLASERQSLAAAVSSLQVSCFLAEHDCSGNLRREVCCWCGATNAKPPPARLRPPLRCRSCRPHSCRDSLLYEAVL